MFYWNTFYRHRGDGCMKFRLHRLYRRCAPCLLATVLITSKIAWVKVSITTRLRLMTTDIFPKFVCSAANVHIWILCPLSLVEVASTGYKRIRGFLIQALRADPNQDQTEPVGGFVRQSNTKPVCFSDDGAGVSLMFWCCWCLQYHKSVRTILERNLTSNLM